MAPALILVAALGLAACDTAEERAEAHYQRGMALLAEGETERAMVEFRNVFRLDGDHTAARHAYAAELVAQGEIGEAIGQYLRLVEQDWTNAEGHKRLTELALSIQDFGTARTHAARAYEIDPEDPEIRAFKAALDFRAGRREEAVAMARGVLEEVPDNLPARMVLVGERMEAGDLDAALEGVERALATAPEDEGVHFAKLALLERMGDTAGLGRHLARMTEIFPGNEAITQGLIRWHLEEGDTDSVEAILRERAAREAPGSAARRDADLMLTGFLYEMRGADAARAELERLAAAAPEGSEANIAYRRARAGIDMQEGRSEEAIAALRGILDGAEPSDARRDTEIALAEILATIGRADEAEPLVDAVLAADSSHVGGLKLRARRLIDADRPDEAIRDLRTALNQEPRDADILTLMAVAHERAGARELAGERLAMAVEVSGRGSAESIRYARFLTAEGRTGPAETVLTEALRARPGDPDLLAAVAQIHLDRRDWARATRTAGLLREQGGPRGEALAAQIEAAALGGQNRHEETLAMLRELAAGDLRVAGDVVRTYLVAGNVAGAQAYVESRLAELPDEPALRMAQAGLLAIAGDTEAAEEAYRALLADHPAFVPGYEALHGLLASSGRTGEATALLEEGIAATDEAPPLMFIEAGEREARGDFEGAIAIYETLYARDTSSTLIANNLASLIATHRRDAESLERAFAIARRLRGTDVPHFADTYGWILARRGDHAEALPYLERAAAGLPGDPLVQYHLGVTQHRLGRAADARESLERALAVAGPDSGLPQMEEARAVLAAIEGGDAALEAAATREGGGEGGSAQAVGQ